MPPQTLDRLHLAAGDAGLELRVALARLYSETDRFLDHLAMEVRECKGVEEASRYCRWLQFSGVLKLLELHKEVLSGLSTPVAPSLLRRKVDDLLLTCGDLFRGGKANPTYAQSDIVLINQKLDALHALLSTSGPGTEVHPSSTLQSCDALSGCVSGPQFLDLCALRRSPKNPKRQPRHRVQEA
jgi:hypothetical protein